MAAGAASLTGRDSFWWMRTGYFPATSYVVVSPLSTRTQSTSRKGLQTNLHNSQHRRPLNCTEVIKVCIHKIFHSLHSKVKLELSLQKMQQDNNENEPNGSWRRSRLIKTPNGVWKRIGRLFRVKYVY